MAQYTLQNSVYINTPDGTILFPAGRIIDAEKLNFPIERFIDAGARLAPISDTDALNQAEIVRKYEARGLDPTKDPNVGQGFAVDSDFRVVADLVERDAIFRRNRTIGMHVYVVSNDTTYRLESDLVTWGDGSEGVDSITAGTHIVLTGTASNPIINLGTLTQDDILPAFAVGLALTGTTTARLGQSIVTPAFSATYNRTPVAAVLTDTEGTSPKNVISTPNSFTSNGTFVKNTIGAAVTFTLTANEAGGPSHTGVATLGWGIDVYFGAAVPGTFNEAFIEALPGDTVATSPIGSFSANAGATQKVYLASPASWGTPTFTSGGFSGTFPLVATVNVTNAFGITTSYKLWESGQFNLGSISFTVSWS